METVLGLLMLPLAASLDVVDMVEADVGMEGSQATSLVALHPLEVSGAVCSWTFD